MQEDALLAIIAISTLIGSNARSLVVQSMVMMIETLRLPLSVKQNPTMQTRKLSATDYLIIVYNNSRAEAIYGYSCRDKEILYRFNISRFG